MNQYGVVFNKEKMAKAHGIFPVSTKQSIEIALRIKGKRLERAKNLLQSVIDKRRPIKYTRSNAPHKKGTGPGRYPLKAALYFAKLLDMAEANAHFQGINTEDLVVKKVIVNRVSRPMRYGRNPGRISKRTGVWLVLEQVEMKESKSKTEKKRHDEKKTEIKGDAKKREAKLEAELIKKDESNAQLDDKDEKKAEAQQETIKEKTAEKEAQQHDDKKEEPKSQEVKQ